MTLVRLIGKYLKQYKWLAAGVLVLQSLQALCQLYLPTLNADLIDKGVLTGNKHEIWHLGGRMLMVTVLQMFLSLGAVYCGARVAMAFGRDVRRDLFHRVTSYSAREVNLFGAPSLITRITNDVQQVQMLVVMGCLLLVTAPVTMIGGVILALNQDVGMTRILLISMPALAISMGLIVWRMVPQYRRMQELIDHINRVLREQITGMRVVRAFVREPDETERFAERNANLTGVSLSAGRLMALMLPTLMLIVNLSSVAVLWVGANEITAGHLSVGSLVAFLSYFILILTSVMMATFVAVMAPRAAVCAERIEEVIGTDSSVVAAENPITELTQSGALELRDISFQYPGAESAVLSGVSVRSLAGQTTAVVGSTGAGKTTLINLVARLFDSTAGDVLVDGVNVRDLGPEALWGRVGLVPQKPYLFSGTVASNLQFGKDDASEHEMWEALRVAQAEDFVREMGGLEARIAQGGSNVSGGQRQRLAIARALVRKPEIYLFDDSFSALDVATDARLRAALGPYTAGSTVLVVAQRVSTIVAADQIVVLDHGEVVGLGTHEELLDTCETYAEIVESQIGEGRAA